MTFHSLDYVVFFLIVTAVYWRLSHRWQNRFLLVRQLPVLRVVRAVVLPAAGRHHRWWTGSRA